MLGGVIEVMTLMEHECRMTEEYCASLQYYMGKKYVKVTDGSSVKAFVVACEDDKKFQYGDILKPAVENSCKELP